MLSAAANLAAANPAADLLARFGVTWASLLSAALNFALVAAVLYYFAFRPVLRTLDERNRKIEDGLRFAEEARAKLDAAGKESAARLDAAAAEAARVARDAEQRARVAEDALRAGAERRAADILTRAEERIALERARMLAEVRAGVAALVVETTSKVLARELSDAERARFNAAAAAALAENSGGSAAAAASRPVPPPAVP